MKTRTFTLNLLRIVLPVLAIAMWSMEAHSMSGRDFLSRRADALKKSKQPSELQKTGEAIATSDAPNPLVQGGKAIGQTYEAADSGDITGQAIEAADGVGKLSSIYLGATEGMKLGAFGGPLAPITVPLGGIIGGYIGKKLWDFTGGAINEKSRDLHQKQQAQAREKKLAGPKHPINRPGHDFADMTRDNVRGIARGTAGENTRGGTRDTTKSTTTDSARSNCRCK